MMLDLSLVFVSLLMFGCHCAKAMLPIFAVYLIKYQSWSPSGYAVMLSSLYCSSAVLPLFVGMTVDKEQLDKRALLVGLLTCTVVGQALFALSLHMDWYGLSIGAQCVFGLAASSLVVVQRTIIAAKFKGQHAFALGCAMSASNLAKICGKAAAAPLAVLLNSYLRVADLSVLFCMCSLFFGIHVAYCSGVLEGDVECEFSPSGGQPEELKRLLPATELELELELTAGRPELTAGYGATQTSGRVGGDGSLLERKRQFQRARQSAVRGRVHLPKYLRPASRVPCCTAFVGDVPRSRLENSYQHNDVVVPAESVPVVGLNAFGRAWHWLSALQLHLRQLGAEFYVVAGINAMFLMTYHSFWNFAPHMFVSAGVDVVWVGVIISLPSLAVVFVAPAVGASMDQIGNYNMHACLAAGMTTIIGFGMLLVAASLPAGTTPDSGSLALYIVPSVLLAAAGAVMPATTMATIPSILARQAARLPTHDLNQVGAGGITSRMDRSGTAFGMLEIMLQVSHMAGNLMFGYLYNSNGENGYQASILFMFVIAIVTSAGAAGICYRQSSSSSARAGVRAREGNGAML